MSAFGRLARIVAEHGSAALVTVHRAEGSTPREAGARLVVRPDGAFHGTIGGGRLEWEALQLARDALAEGRGPARFVTEALGPDLGQCCGGRVTLLVETFDARDAAELAALAGAEGQGPFEVEAWMGEEGRVRRGKPSPLCGGGCPRDAGAGEGPSSSASRSLSRLAPLATLSRGGERVLRWRETLGTPLTPLLLFGAGHVGRALVLALAPLPFAVRWIDPRADAFPSHVPANAAPVRSPDPPAEIAAAPAGAFVLVMTHEHALDLAITTAALKRGDLPFVGLIGSATKRARFERRLRAGGVSPERLVCPIGVAGIEGKEPAVIAAATAAQLLQERDRAATDPKPRHETIEG